MNDNDIAPGGDAPPAPDAHGHAALLLVESLIHGLLARSVITVDEAVEIVVAADDVQVEVAGAAGDAAAPMWRSHVLLSAIGQSLLTNSLGAPPAATAP